MKPITLTLQRSVILAILFATAWLFFTVMLLIVPLPLIYKLSIILISLMATIYFILRDALLKLAWSPQSVSCNIAEEWQLTNQNGMVIRVRIVLDSYVGECLTILHCVPLNGSRYAFWLHRHIILLQDNTHTELFRRLRVRLLWGGSSK